MTATIQLQFRGYQPTTEQFPLDRSPFERVESADQANEMIESALMGDEDEDGWVSAEIAGEDVRLRRC